MAIGVHNDYCDRALDRRAKPWRAIPSGLVSPAQALQLAAVLLAASLALAVPLGRNIAALGVLGTGMGFAYNARLKRTVFAWLPFWVALPTLVIASFAVVHAYQDDLLLTYLIGLPLVFPVYIADSLTDIDSDRTFGAGGLSQVLGHARARAACWGSLALGYVLAFALWPEGSSPGVLSGISLGLLGAAVASDRLRIPRVHWLAVMLAVVALAADWLLGVPITSR